MAILNSNGISIKGIACILPKNKEDNLNIDFIDKNNLKRIIEHTGIKYRYTIKNKKSTIKEGFYQAVKKLLSNTSWDEKSVDILITITQSSGNQVPAISCQLQNEFNFSNRVLAYDINLGCSGFVYGLNSISQLLKSIDKPSCRAILCCGDYSSQLIQKEDPSVRPIFSDAVSATAIEFNRNDSSNCSFNLETFGEGKSAIYTDNDGYMRLNGIDVFNYSMQYVPNNIEQLLQSNSLKANNIKQYFFHQANKIINDSLQKKLKLNDEQVQNSIQLYGNTSTASIPITIAKAVLDDTLAEGWTVLSGFGVGFSVASALIKMETLASSITFFDL